MNRRKVLLVEDNRLLRWWMLLDLYEAGYWVAAPDSPEDAVRLANTSEFDVLITDWRLPESHTGFEMLSHAKTTSPAVLSVLISAEMNEEMAYQAHCAGFDQTLAKPFQRGDLLQALQKPCSHTPTPAPIHQEVAQ